MKKYIKKQKNFGQTLAEIIIAIGLLAIVFTGGLQIINNSFISINNQTTELKSHYLIVEGLEGIRSIRDEDWNSLIDGTWYFEINPANPQGPTMELKSGEQKIWNIFTRKIIISSVRRDTSTGKITQDQLQPIDVNTKQIDVTVTWNYKGQQIQRSETIYLTNWDRF